MTTMTQNPRSALLATVAALIEQHGLDFDEAVCLVKQRRLVEDHFQKSSQLENQWLTEDLKRKDKSLRERLSFLGRFYT